MHVYDSSSWHEVGELGPGLLRSMGSSKTALLGGSWCRPDIKAKEATQRVLTQLTGLT